MKFRRTPKRTLPVDSMADTRDGVRELAESLGLYGSAMRRLADREAARPWVAECGAAHPVRPRLLLAPVLAAALVAALYLSGHAHRVPAVSASAVKVAHQVPADAAVNADAHIDDTVLMNQIDSEVSEYVPDALQPLTALSEQGNNNASASENNHATQE